MAGNETQFVTHWRVEGTVAEVCTILRDAESLPHWWPTVFMDASIDRIGDRQGIDQVVQLYTRGRLPHTLRWRYRIISADPPKEWCVEVRGDLAGSGRVILSQNEPQTVDVCFGWQVRPQKPLVRLFCAIFRSSFAAEHRWVMEQGEEGLRSELQRRRAPSEGPSSAPLPAAGHGYRKPAAVKGAPAPMQWVLASQQGHARPIGPVPPPTPAPAVKAEVPRPAAPQSITQRFHRELLQQGCLDAAHQILDPDFRWHASNPQQETIAGLEGFIRHASVFHASFSDLAIETVDSIIAGDQVVERWRLHATHTDEAMGVPATGRKVTLCGVDIFRLVDGKVAELWQFWNREDLQDQLRATPISHSALSSVP